MYFNYYNSCGLDGGADCSIEVASTAEQDYIYYRAIILGNDPNNEPLLQDLISTAYKEAMEFELNEYGSDNEDYEDERRYQEREHILELARERNVALFKAVGIYNIDDLEDDIRAREDYDLLAIFELEQYVKPDEDDDDYEPEDAETAKENDEAIEEFLSTFDFREWVDEAYDNDLFWDVDIYEIDPEFKVDYSSCFDNLSVSLKDDPEYDLDDLISFMKLAVEKSDLEFIHGIINYAYQEDYCEDDVVSLLATAKDNASTELMNAIVEVAKLDYQRRKANNEYFEEKNAEYIEFCKEIGVL